VVTIVGDASGDATLGRAAAAAVDRLLAAKEPAWQRMRVKEKS
jgi:hypothetical protein